MDNIGVFGTFGRKTLAIMLICIGDGIRDSLFNTIPTQFLLTRFIGSVLLCTVKRNGIVRKNHSNDINKKPSDESEGFCGAYGTRTRDLLRDRQAF